MIFLILLAVTLVAFGIFMLAPNWGEEPLLFGLVLIFVLFFYSLIFGILLTEPHEVQTTPIQPENGEWADLGYSLEDGAVTYVVETADGPVHLPVDETYVEVSEEPRIALIEERPHDIAVPWGGIEKYTILYLPEEALK